MRRCISRLCTKRRRDETEVVVQLSRSSSLMFIQVPLDAPHYEPITRFAPPYRCTLSARFCPPVRRVGIEPSANFDFSAARIFVDNSCPAHVGNIKAVYFLYPQSHFETVF